MLEIRYAYAVHKRYTSVQRAVTYYNVCKRVNTYHQRVFIHAQYVRPIPRMTTYLICVHNVLAEFLIRRYTLMLYVVVWQGLYHFRLYNVLKIVRMIRKYHNHKLQTNPWHREEEPHKNHQAPGGQTKPSNQLSLTHQDDCKTRMDTK